MVVGSDHLRLIFLVTLICELKRTPAARFYEFLNNIDRVLIWTQCSMSCHHERLTCFQMCQIWKSSFLLWCYYVLGSTDIWASYYRATRSHLIICAEVLGRYNLGLRGGRLSLTRAARAILMLVLSQMVGHIWFSLTDCSICGCLKHAYSAVILCRLRTLCCLCCGLSFLSSCFFLLIFVLPHFLSFKVFSELDFFFSNSENNPQ